MADDGLVVVKVIPASRSDQIVGLVGEVLKIKVCAPAEHGRANQALIELLADRLGLHRSTIQIVRGHTSQLKYIQVQGLTSRQVLERLGLL